jgi:acyl carrier protein
MTATRSLEAKSEAQLRQELRGFPEAATSAVFALREDPSLESLRLAVRRVLAFYLPRPKGRSLDELPAETRLREELGVDSLTMAEAAFKLDELLGVEIGTRDAAAIRTLGELEAFLADRLGLGQEPNLEAHALATAAR